MEKVLYNYSITICASFTHSIQIYTNESVTAVNVRKPNGYVESQVRKDSRTDGSEFKVLKSKSAMEK